MHAIVLILLLSFATLASAKTFTFADVGFLGRVVSPAQDQGTPVDTMLKFDGDNDELLTTNLITSSLHGDTNWLVSYTQSHTNLQHTFITNNSVTLAWSMNVDGVLHSNFTQAVVFDTYRGDTNRSPIYEGFSLDPVAAVGQVTVAGIYRFEDTGYWNNDTYHIASGDSIAVAQMIFDQSGGGALWPHPMTPLSTGTMPLYPGTNYFISLRNNTNRNTEEIIVLEAETGDLVGAAELVSNGTLGDVSFIKFEDYLWSVSDIHTNKGRLYHGALFINDSTAPLPLAPMPTVPPVTNLLAVQFETNQVDITWESPVSCYYLLEKNDGTNWTTLSSNLYAKTWSDTNSITVSNTYTYRVTTLAVDYQSTTVTSDALTITNNPPPSFLTFNDFEESGIPSGWFGGSADYDYTPAIAGSESLNASTGDAYIIDDAIELGEVYYKSRFILTNVTSEAFLMLFRDTAANACLVVHVLTDGKLRIQGFFGASTVSSVSADTPYYLWLRYKKGTGANGITSIAFSATDSEPTSGNNFAGISNDTWTQNVNQIEHFEGVYDDITTSTGVIP